MSGFRVLVIGGYGFFGRRLVERLGRDPRYEVVLGGRSLEQARSAVAALQPAARARLEATRLDATAPASLAQALQQWQPQLVVHTSGPFQGQDYRVAQACIDARTHYVDLADGREFVCGIGGLDAAACRRGVLVASGASSVPALSAAAADHLVAGWQRVDRIDIGISPGNRTDRGLATVTAILSYCGQPLPGRSGAVGWSGRWRHRYAAPVGERLLSPCDVPDLALLPARYPGQPAVRFGAGLELRWMHRGMNLMAALARRGWVRDWSAHARLLKAVADRVRRFGSDAGAMHVEAQGLDAAGRPARRQWELLATAGDGPSVPTLAAAALARRLAGGDLVQRGALPCLGLLTLDDFAAQAQGLQIVMKEIEP